MLLDHRHKNSCFWLLTEAEFKEWYEGPTDILWISGDAGTGKSTLLAFLVDHLKTVAIRRSPSIAASTVYSVFCEELEQNRRNATDVLRSLMVQMAVRDKVVLHTLRNTFSKVRQSFEYSLKSVWKFFIIALRACKESRIYIVLDGFGGVEKSSSYHLLQHLWTLTREPKLMDGANKGLKIILSARPNQSETLWARVRSGIPCPQIQLEDGNQGLKDDISNVIRDGLDDLVISGKMSKQDTEQYYPLIRHNARSSFLWTHMILQEIKQSVMTSRASVRNVLFNLPRNLQDVYSQYLSQIDVFDTLLLKKLLNILVASFRPLRMDELSILLVIRPDMTESELEEERVVHINVELLLGPLVRFKDNTVHFMHPSVREYFIRLGADREHPLHISYGVDPSTAHEILANACLDYLHLATFGRSIRLFEPTLGSTKYANSENDALSEAGSVKIIDDRFDVNIGEIGFLREEAQCIEDAVVALVHAHKAYEYAALYWALHVAACAEVATTTRLATRMFLQRDKMTFGNWHQVFASLTKATVPNLDEMRNPLVMAGYFGWKDVAKHLLDSDGSMDEAITGTALLWSIRKQQEETAYAILQFSREAFLDLPPFPYIIAACQVGFRGILKVVLCKAPSASHRLNENDEHGRTALHYAAELNNADILGDLLKNPDVNIYARDRLLRTALHDAADYGSRDAVKVLLQREPALASTTDCDRNTPLLCASKTEFLSVVKLLNSIEGGNSECKDIKGRTPLSYAMAQLNVSIVKYLLQSGSQANMKDNNGRNPLSWAISAPKSLQRYDEKLDLCRLVAVSDRKALDEPDSDGWTPLFWALDTPGYPDGVAALVNTGSIDINRQDNGGRTALSWAAASGYSEIVDILIRQSQIDLAIIDEDGKTALAHAASHGCESIAMTLIKVAPHALQVLDKSDRSPADWAALNGHEALAWVLSSV